ncbi:hypothetical protein CXY98_12265 [Staphylococcus aureus]|nr:hypothetical protein CXY97_01150 [Staphylococcus aureus]PKR01446.1 hypothetical protein CXY96_12370 [Staphylococcus aureus]PKR07133.1 hypothetical protein CXY98_12265 [Staphylococcus aureus]
MNESSFLHLIFLILTQFLIFTTKAKNYFEQINLIVIILYFKSSYQNYKTIKSKDKVSVIYY